MIIFSGSQQGKSRDMLNLVRWNDQVMKLDASCQQDADYDFDIDFIVL